MSETPSGFVPGNSNERPNLLGRFWQRLKTSKSTESGYAHQPESSSLSSGIKDAGSLDETKKINIDEQNIALRAGRERR